MSPPVVTNLSPEPVVLETDVPLSQSMIWRLQREFYVQRGLKVWTEDQVPNLITNNPFFAEIYARIVFSFLQDCIEAGLSSAAPLRVLELGAGTGKFAYLFLRRLTELLRAEDIPLKTIRYCMTDCSPQIVESWHASTYLRALVESGVLVFELFQVGEPTKSSFLNNAGPLVVIANYVFDSLPQDAFVVQDGKLFESLVTTSVAPGYAAAGPRISQLQLAYKNAGVPNGRYPEQSWNQILENYRERVPVATILFPLQALKVLTELARLADGRMLVVAADKGFAHEDALPLSQGPPALELHTPDCFSQMVNLDAIGKYFQAIGGQALIPDKHFSTLNICAFLWGPAGLQFPATRDAYEEIQSAFGVDDLFTLLAWLNAHMEEMSVPQVLSALRLTRWDPIAFMRLFPVLSRQVRTVSRERIDLRNAVLRTWANHYPVSARENEIAFHCGVILLELRFFHDALEMFRISQRIFGPSAATSYNLGLCFQGLGQPSDALARMIEACNLDPAFQPARLLRAKLEAQIATSCSHQP
jgi:tetratricopeptide (TPR) repeat protein